MKLKRSGSSEETCPWSNPGTWRHERLTRWVLIAGVAGWLALFCLGCATASSRTFSLGIYSVRRPEDLPLIKAAGFDRVAGSADARYLRAARQSGLQVLASLGSEGHRPLSAAQSRTIRWADGHPALWAWCLWDEPDLHRVAPGEVLKARRRLKSIGVRKPAVVVLNNGNAAADYVEGADSLMIDRYPVPWLPLADFSKHLGLVRGACQGRPWLAVIQAFDWTYHQDALGLPVQGRPPTEAEMRCMTYLALAQGARGVFYYEFDGRWSMKEHPETWSALRRVVAEVHEKRPLFQAEHRWWARRHAYGDVATQFNEALDSSVASVLLRVRHGTAAVPCGDYVLAINTTAHTLHYRFTPPSGVDGAVEVMGEHRGLAVLNGWVEDEFHPYAVHVYGPWRPEVKK